jgi:transposase
MSELDLDPARAAALRRAVCHDPFDPTPREALADFYREAGYPAAAERLARRAAFLRTPAGEATLRPVAGLVPGAIGRPPPAAAWQSRQEATIVGHALWLREEQAAGEPGPAVYDEVHLPDLVWQKYGRRLFSRHPVLVISLHYRRPHRQPDHRGYVFSSRRVRAYEAGSNDSSFVGKILRAFWPDPWPDGQTYLGYANYDQAMAALSLALVRHGRHAAKLPPLE